MTTTYRPGDIVQYARPEPGEESLTFTVIENNVNRLLLESRDFPDARITPREVVAVDDVTLTPPCPFHAQKQALCGWCSPRHAS